MNKFDELKEKANRFELKKSWQWLLYLYLVLPLLLFVIGVLGGDGAIGTYFSKIFHSYNLYVISPLVDFASLTGIIGVIIPGYLLFKAYRRKDYKDIGISIALFLCIAVYFYFEVNYMLLKFLQFGGGTGL